MKKLQIDKNQRALIESVIRENNKFRGNEELLEMFCEAIYRKSYLIMDAIRDMSRLRRHLLMISDSCMDSIIKEKKKFEQSKLYQEIERRQRMTPEVVSVKNRTLEDDEELHEELKRHKAKESLINLKEEIKRSELYDSSDMLIDPAEFCPKKRISENTLEKLIQIVKAVDSQYPNKKYFKIFSMRYLKRFNQVEIAKNLNISQVELSKRFVEMVKLTGECL